MQPVPPRKRILSIDALRGFALLGILMMNVVSFSLPDPAYWDPSGHGGDTGWNLGVFILNCLLVDGSMRAVFSMLFGAGVILFTTDAEKKGGEGEAAGAWYRRTIWLILFGIVHAYLLIFPGEILFCYGVVGLFLYPVRKVPARRLLLFSLFLVAALGVIRSVEYRNNVRLSETSEMAERSLAAGEAITPVQTYAMSKWQTRLQSYKPDQAARDAVVASMRSGYPAALRSMAPYVRFMQTEHFYHTGFLDALSMMLLGMALFRWGIFHAGKKYRFYLLMMAVGYGAGITVNWLEASAYIRSDFDLLTYFRIDRTFDAGRILMATGHIGLVMTFVKLGILPWLGRALAAVGRMALTNYVMHTFIGLLIFIFFRQYGQWQRYQLFFLVVCIWIFQLVASPLYLRRFRYGPLEWVWRRLTYGRGFAN